MNESDRDAAPELSATVIAQAVERASKRSSAFVHEELHHGLNGLATVASIAPLFAFFGTLIGIVNSFIGCGGERSACMAALADRLSGAIWPIALGLTVGLASLWCYRYLAARLEAFDHEMKDVSLELANQLILYRRRLRLALANKLVCDVPMFGWQSPAWTKTEQRPVPHAIVGSAAALALAWCLQVFRYFAQDFLPIGSAIPTACIHVLFVIALSYVPAYGVWAKLLHRRPGGLLALGSAFCLIWCLAEVVLGVRLYR